jgi:hypothetical protein
MSNADPSFARCSSFILVQTIEFGAHLTSYMRSVFDHASRCRSRMLVGCHNYGSCMRTMRETATSYPDLNAHAFSWTMRKGSKPWMTFGTLPIIVGPSMAAGRRPTRGTPRFLVVGSVMDSKRHYQLLAKLTPPEPIVFVVFGRCGIVRFSFCQQLHSLQMHPNVRVVYERGEFTTLVQLLREATYVVPLITEHVPSSIRYSTFDKVSSSISLALAHGVPLVAWQPLLLGLGLTQQVAHTDAGAFPEAIYFASNRTGAQLRMMRSEMLHKAALVLKDSLRKASRAWKDTMTFQQVRLRKEAKRLKGSAMERDSFSSFSEHFTGLADVRTSTLQLMPRIDGKPPSAPPFPSPVHGYTTTTKTLMTLAIAVLCCVLVSILAFSVCSSSPTDQRTLHQLRSVRSRM